MTPPQQIKITSSVISIMFGFCLGLGFCLVVEAFGGSPAKAGRLPYPGVQYDQGFDQRYMLDLLEENNALLERNDRTLTNPYRRYEVNPC